MDNHHVQIRYERERGDTFVEESELIWMNSGILFDSLPDMKPNSVYQYTVTGRVRMKEIKDSPAVGFKLTLNHHELALFRYGTILYCSQARCPHLGGPLHLGEIEEINETSVCIRCPWHKWTFNLNTGRCVLDDHEHHQDVRLTRYPTRIVDGMIRIGFQSLDRQVFREEEF